MKKIKNIFKISNRYIGNTYPCFVIAEAGVNHNGSLKLAKEMIDIAKSSGADAVKFQTFKAERLVIPGAPKADYQKKTMPGKTQFQILKELELSESEFKELFTYCQRKKIIFISTPFDSQSAEFLYKLGVPAFKIASGELTNFPLLLQVAAYKKPLILATGMATLKEVKEALDLIYFAGNKKIILLHCTSNYPADYQDVNLKAINTLKREFNTLVGYSDHTLGIEVAIAAAATGASIIEKHFTLDRDMKGPDHKASLEPEELKTMIEAIRNIEVAFGNGVKQPAKNEGKIRDVARKSIVAKVNIPKDSRVMPEMIDIRRPGTGIEPRYLNKILGKKAIRNIRKDSLIKYSFLK